MSEPKIYVTVEFQADEKDRDKISKLIAYARRIGVTAYATDSFDANEGGEPASP